MFQRFNEKWKKYPVRQALVFATAANKPKKNATAVVSGSERGEGGEGGRGRRRGGEGKAKGIIEGKEKRAVDQSVHLAN
jgi:hypothetical protein